MQAMDMDSFGQDDDLKDQLGSSLKESLDTSEVHGKVAPSGTEATHTEPEKKVGKVVYQITVFKTQHFRSIQK